MMNRRKSLVRWLALLLLVVAVVGVTFASAKEPAAKAAGLSLEDMPIVLPANVTDVEKTAAKELQHYLKEMTGTNSSIITESVPVENAIYLGATKFAEANNVTYTDKNGMGEGWAIKAIGNNIVLTGGETRGTLYAVYHLLEDHFGVHWWNMWEEYVPTMNDAEVPFDYDHSGEPLFADRTIYTVETKTSLYYVRNRMNGFTSNAPQSYGGENNYARPYHVHTFNRYFPAYYAEPTSAASARWTEAINPEGVNWYEEHPEWYAYSSARGERISFGQMCLTNEELMEVFAEKAIKAIELSYEDADRAGVARPLYIDISPNDMGGHCECDDCRAVEAASGPSGRLLKFVNKVAEGIEKVYPEIKVETLAYAAYFELPLDDTKPRHNVVVRLASSDVDIVHNMDHPNNVKVKNRLYQWGSILEPGQLMYWDYGIVLDDYGVLPNMFKFGSDYRQVYENGGMGIFTEFQRYNTVDFWDMKHWILTKVIEDPYQDEYELAMTFLKGYYGEAAAEPLYEYLRFMEDCAAEHNEIIKYGDMIIDAPWLDGEEIVRGDAYFEEAIAGLKADTSLSDAELELALTRVNAARGGLDRLILTNYEDYVMDLYNEGKPFGLDRQVIGKRMIDGLTWLMDMENEHDYTGIESFGLRGTHNGSTELNTFAKYAAEKDENTGELLARPPIPEQIYEDHPGIADVHIHDYLASNFFHAGIYVQYPHVDKVSYAASWEGGSAIVIDQDVLFDWAEEYGGGTNTYVFSETKSLATNLGAMYLNDPIIADGEYHLYRLPNRTVISEGRTKISFFNDIIRCSVKDLTHLADDPVDVYVSMKVEGDPTGEDPNNLAKIYLDRVLLVEPCSAYEINYDTEVPATCSTNAYKVGDCPVCGQEATYEIPYSREPHKLVSDYTYDVQTNTYSAECAVCGEAFFDVKGQLPDELLDVLAAEDITLDSIYDFGVSDFVTSAERAEYQDIIRDADSMLGMTVRWDYSKISEAQRGYFQITDSRPMAFAHGKGTTAPYADDMILDGDYHLYKLEDVPLVNDTNSKLIFFNWSLQVDCSGLTHLKNRKVDVYFSMKVEGELDYAEDAANPPFYYIDRVIVVAGCGSHTSSEYTWDAAQQLYIGECDDCGKTVTHAFAAELPQQVLDNVAAHKSDLSHVHEYAVEDFFSSNYINDYRTIIEDEGSVMDKVLKMDSSKANASVRQQRFVFSDAKPFALTAQRYSSSQNPPVTFDTIAPAVLNANSGDGQYHIYEMSGLLIPSAHQYTWGFDYTFQFSFSDIKNFLQDKNVDLYLSMKVEGDVTYTTDKDSAKMPKYYIDRVIVVDNCGNHISKDDAEFVSAATCYKGDTYEGICTYCGKISETEDVETRLAHVFGAFEASADGKTQIAKCRNDGCTVTKEMRYSAALPQEVLDDVNAAGLGLEHIFDYGPSTFKLGVSTVLELVEDSESAYGAALMVPNDYSKLSNPALYMNLPSYSYMRKIGVSNGGDLAYLDADELKANQGKGYCLYKFEDVTLPESSSSYGYVSMFNGPIQNWTLATKLREFEGQQIDLYISLKIEGQFGSSVNKPAFYVDRMILVTDCENHGLQYETIPGSDCTQPNKRVAVCDVCGKEYVEIDGVGATHSFTKYLRDEVDKYLYVAQCDYGCGATDTKYDPKLTVEEKLPAELPDNVKKHVLFSYSCDEITLSGVDDAYRWDFELDRPVGVLEYEIYESSALIFTGNGGPSTAMYPVGQSARPMGSFEGVAANSGKGYQLYSLKGVVPIQARAYNYFFFFSNWCVQIHMLDDDLIQNGYRDKSVDLYLYMKAEGDTSAVSENKPIYYIDQLIVAESCAADETWTTVREATCSQTGLMVGDCAVCGLQNSEVELPKLPHVMSKTVLEKKATCLANEYRYGLCDICGARESQQVEGTMLEHSFSNYVKQNDGTGREIAYCDNGCGERRIRTANLGMQDVTTEIPENIQQILPVIGKPATHGVSFSDIKSSDWYFDAVKEAVDNKLINGVTATEFRPNETLTVAQAVKLASAYHEMNYTGDVTLENGAGNWYSSYVDYAVENSIIGSDYASMSTAEMNKPIDRSEFVAIFEKAMDEGSLTGYNTVADNAIPDVKTGDANAEAIYKFYRAGILTGSDGKGTFNPHSPIKRSEVATILSRMYNENVRQSITLN